MKKLLMLLIVLLGLVGCSTLEEKTVDPYAKYYGTWVSCGTKVDGVYYSVAELEKAGEYAASDMYLVIKEGGVIYVTSLYDGSEESCDWSKEEDGSILVNDRLKFIFNEKEELLAEADNGAIIYFKRYSDSQDMTEIPVKIEEDNSFEKEEAVEKKKEEQKADNNTIRADVKTALDGFEEFIDEYCLFMKKYAADSSNLSLLVDYATFMGRYAEMSEKMDKLEDDLNDAELKYYTQVMLRCDQKLLEVLDD